MTNQPCMVPAPMFGELLNQEDRERRERDKDTVAPPGGELYKSVAPPSDELYNFARNYHNWKNPYTLNPRDHGILKLRIYYTLHIYDIMPVPRSNPPNQFLEYLKKLILIFDDTTYHIYLLSTYVRILMSLLYMYQKLKWKATVSEFYGEIKFVKEFESQWVQRLLLLKL